MPLTELQARLLRLLAANRSPDSYLAGATVIHQVAETPRFSQDLDFFHDLEASVAQSAAADAATLAAAGYHVRWLLRTPLFHRAVVAAAGEEVRLEWAQDTAFRFFPVESDPICGYRLHLADAAVNKLLALAGRQEVRDLVDILHLDAHGLSVGALAWAACGKDPGYTPDLLLQHCNRHACCTQDQLNRLMLRQPLDVRALKVRWLQALEQARDLVAALPGDELGCLYLTAQGAVTTPDPATFASATLHRHAGSVRGAWPTLLT
jgi:hypothetical protein